MIAGNYQVKADQCIFFSVVFLGRGQWGQYLFLVPFPFTTPLMNGCTNDGVIKFGDVCNHNNYY